LSELKDVGIDITCTEVGLNRLAALISDGCPRYYCKIGDGNYNTKTCQNKEVPFRNGCYHCWLEYLKTRINVKEK
jgi:hypothetical protein